MLYRVRKRWEDSASQVGAYNVPENARNACEANPGYTAYDESGNPCYTSIGKVKTMSYTAKLLKRVGNIAKGTTVTVTRTLKKKWITKQGIIIPDKSCLELKKQIYDPNYRLTKEQAEEWINTMDIGSETRYLFWANKYGQRVYVFTGSKGHWVGIKNFKCSTGNIDFGDGSDQGVGFNWKIYDKAKVFKGPHGNQYWNQHYSSLWGNSIHQGAAGHPATHGCIGLRPKYAKWAFENLPIGTRVVVF